MTATTIGTTPDACPVCGTPPFLVDVVETVDPATGLPRYQPTVYHCPNEQRWDHQR